MPTHLSHLIALDIDISPNSDGLPGIPALRHLVGASMTIGLILAVAALVLSGAVWAVGSHSSNPHLASRGKTGVLIALVSAVTVGAAVSLVNFFWHVGQTV